MQYDLRESDLNARKARDALGVIDKCQNLPRPESDPCKDHGKWPNTEPAVTGNDKEAL
jgi:hypothetical protein